MNAIAAREVRSRIDATRGSSPRVQGTRPFNLWMPDVWNSDAVPDAGGYKFLTLPDLLHDVIGGNAGNLPPGKE